MKRQGRGFVRNLLLATGLLLSFGSSLAQEQSEDLVTLSVNKTRVVQLERSPKRVSIGNDRVADIMVMGGNQLYVVGKSMGSTNVVLWDGRDRVFRTFNVQVTPDLETLKARLHDLLPDEEIRVHASESSVVLSGEVGSAPKMQMAVDLARSVVAPNEKGPDESSERRVLNMMQVGGAKQVLLEVKVAEVSRTFIKELGVKFHSVTTDGDLSIGAINGPGNLLVEPFDGGGNLIPDGTTLVSPGQLVSDPRIGSGFRELGANDVNNKALIASFLDGTTLFNIIVDAAKEEGLAKVLAEPTLTTLTGEEASFLAGGEFPIPVPTEDGVAIEFKRFGVGLRFLPVVLDSGVISLDVGVNVSELSNENSVVSTVPGASSSFFVPALTMRQAESTVELANGQTIGIAGLINENLRERVNKFPGLGDIPLLGALFRSQEFIKGQTELVIFVTPRFARPVDRSLVRLPTDTFVEPSDTEFYLLGRLQSSREPEPRVERTEETLPSAAGGMEGRFGHDL